MEEPENDEESTMYTQPEAFMSICTCWQEAATRSLDLKPLYLRLAEEQVTYRDKGAPEDSQKSQHGMA
jgi:hypothetical protein